MLAVPVIIALVATTGVTATVHLLPQQESCEGTRGGSGQPPVTATDMRPQIAARRRADQTTSQSRVSAGSTVLCSLRCRLVVVALGPHRLVQIDALYVVVAMVVTVAMVVAVMVVMVMMAVPVAALASMFVPVLVTVMVLVGMPVLGAVSVPLPMPVSVSIRLLMITVRVDSTGAGNQHRTGQQSSRAHYRLAP